MTRRVSTWAGLAMLALVATVAALALAPGGAQALEVGFQDNGFFTEPLAPLASQTMAEVDGSWLRVIVRWSLVAPTGSTMPAGFDPSNPGDPHYRFQGYDAYLRAAAAQHLHVILALQQAPTWAEGPNRPGDSIITSGAWDPDPTQFAEFAHAIATRYSGNFADPKNPGSNLPQVSDWEIWNEENLPEDLSAPNTVGEYRALLNAGYDAIKAVSSTNVVAVGGLAPVGYPPPLAISPLKFAARLLCLRRVKSAFRPVKICRRKTPAKFDVLAFHPYTLAATPSTHAASYNDLLIADSGKLATLVKTADRLHTALPQIKHNLWVTEWSWFTNPPNDLVGDSESAAARYVAYSMWVLWHSGVKLVIWFSVEDPPGNSQTLAGFIDGGGLYTSDGTPKPMLTAFEFPVVASVAHHRGYVWGRAPVSQRVRVTIQRSAPGNRWIRVATARTHTDGTFAVHLRAAKNGVYRATAPGGLASLGYLSRPIKPRRTHGGFPI